MDRGATWQRWKRSGLKGLRRGSGLSSWKKKKWVKKWVKELVKEKEDWVEDLEEE